ncbi:MAG: ABC transporter ATP-binding protein [Promethearchaeota archaeon]
MLNEEDAQNPLIKIRDLKKSYKLNKTISNNILKGVNLDVHKGEFVVLMGPSGAGKTTLLNIIGLIDNYDSGEYFLGSIDTKTLTKSEMRQLRLKKIGFIFQTFNLIESLNVIENVELPLALNGVKQEVQRKKAEELIKLVGLEDRMNNLPNQLSLGEQQRVAIARALVIDPVIIIADEPTGELDRKTGEIILELMKKLLNKKKNVTLICASHNIRVSDYGDITYILRDGILTTSN